MTTRTSFLAVGVAAVALVAVLAPTLASAEHFDRRRLEDGTLSVEVEELGIEHDRDGISMDYEIDRRDARQLTRAGLSLWAAIFTTPGENPRQLGPLWQAAPLLSTDGSHDFAYHLPLDSPHVYVRLVAISNGSTLPAGQGLYTNGAVLLGVEGNHDEYDHDHSSGTGVHASVGHGPNLDAPVEIELAYAGSLHQYGWFHPSNGFGQFRQWLRHQQLWNAQFHDYLHRRNTPRQWHQCRRPPRHHGRHHR